MDPLWLPVLAFMLIAVGAGAAGISLARSGRWKSALKAWGVCIACGVVVYLSSKSAPKSTPPKLVPAYGESTSIVLGGVVLRMERSANYAFSVDDVEFLALKVHGAALRVSGVIGADDRASAKLVENTLPLRRERDLLAEGNEHAMSVNKRGRKIFEVEFDDPSTIEITGEFFGSMYDKGALITCREGVRWGGGELSAGSIVDLRGRKGKRVDFDRSGVVTAKD